MDRYIFGQDRANRNELVRYSWTWAKTKDEAQQGVDILLGRRIHPAAFLWADLLNERSSEGMTAIDWKKTNTAAHVSRICALPLLLMNSVNDDLIPGIHAFPPGVGCSLYLSFLLEEKIGNVSRPDGIYIVRGPPHIICPSTDRKWSFLIPFESQGEPRLAISPVTIDRQAGRGGGHVVHAYHTVARIHFSFCPSKLERHVSSDHQ